MTDHDCSNRMRVRAAGLALGALVSIGCGSQQLRLTAPETTPGIGYTCSSATTCYPASVTAPPEGAKDEAIPLALPRECNGQFHEILVRNADSSSPEIDVTCARPKSVAPAAPAAPAVPVAGMDAPPQ